MDRITDKYCDINICEDLNCQSEGSEEIALDVGNESLTYFVCEQCKSELDKEDNN